MLFRSTQKDSTVNDPEFADIYSIGTAARISKLIDVDGGAVTIILEGEERVMLDEVVNNEPFMTARIQVIPEILPDINDKQFIATVSSIRDNAMKILRQAEGITGEAGFSIRNISNPALLVNFICVNYGIKLDDKQLLLQQEKLTDRADRLLEILAQESQLLDVKQSIQEKAREDMNRQQRNYYLEQQMKTIQKELGDTSEQTINDLRERAKNKNWSEEVSQIFQKELAKLARTHNQSSEFSMQLNYLETLLSLPWNDITEDNYDISNAAQVLDHDHYGMEKVKERILEYLSVLWMRHRLKDSNTRFKAPILCLYGPPGVGKTSLGESVAKALGRKYVRMSLGGVHDESEIRGHRRTYIGAMPGRIIEGIKKVGSANPVFMLDEIDKLSADYHGDPTSALLEVLDPEQNSKFHDNYIDVDYDLSKVLFIATANSLQSIPRPLLDRMELIEMTGYLTEEKIQIAKQYLVPNELQSHGLTSENVEFTDVLLEKLIEGYTRESGVRELNRQIAALCRKVVKQIASNTPYNIQLTQDDLQHYLGKQRFTREMYENNKYMGVVTGLAWTQVGGEILFIECSLSQAKTPTLILTGNLGDVMKESATIALGYIKAHAKELGIDQKKIDTSSVHIHVPEGAIPKDGPSAGITMTTAMVSAFLSRRVRERLAMTGEITLRGKVLPVGGIKEKILAAKRAGITDIVMCRDNEKDINEIPEIYLKGVTFHYVENVKDVWDFALTNEKVSNPLEFTIMEEDEEKKNSEKEK